MKLFLGKTKTEQEKRRWLGIDNVTCASGWPCSVWFHDSVSCFIQAKKQNHTILISPGAIKRGVSGKRKPTWLNVLCKTHVHGTGVVDSGARLPALEFWLPFLLCDPGHLVTFSVPWFVLWGEDSNITFLFMLLERLNRGKYGNLPHNDFVVFILFLGGYFLSIADTGCCISFRDIPQWWLYFF